MARDLSEVVSQEIQKRVVLPVYLFEGEFANGFTRLWSGIGDLVVDGDTYTGAGQLAGLTQVTETDDIAAAGIRVRLSGLPAASISLALAQTRTGKTGVVSMGFMSESDTWVDEDGDPIVDENGIAITTASAGNILIDDPFPIFSGKLDTAEIEADGQTGEIRLAYESDLIDLERARVRRYTDEDQKLDYPEDTFFKQVEALQQKEVLWGRGK